MSFKNPRNVLAGIPTAISSANVEVMSLMMPQNTVPLRKVGSCAYSLDPPRLVQDHRGCLVLYGPSLLSALNPDMMRMIPGKYLRERYNV